MSTQPTGSGTLLCPVGDQYGTIDPAQIDSFTANGHLIVEVTPHVFAQWYQNAKRIKSEYTYDSVDTADPGSDVHVGDTHYVTQWRFPAGFGSPLTENTSNHPFPYHYLHDGHLANSDTSYLDDPERVLYLEEGSHATSAAITWVPYIHQGRFYIVMLIGLYDIVVAHSINEASMSYTHQTGYDTWTETAVRTLTIDQKFYP